MTSPCLTISSAGAEISSGPPGHAWLPIPNCLHQPRMVFSLRPVMWTAALRLMISSARMRMGHAAEELRCGAGGSSSNKLNQQSSCGACDDVSPSVARSSRSSADRSMPRRRHFARTGPPTIGRSHSALDSCHRAAARPSRSTSCAILLKVVRTTEEILLQPLLISLEGGGDVLSGAAPIGFARCRVRYRPADRREPALLHG